VKILLDVMDQQNARSLRDKYGIDNTYLFLEYQSITAEVGMTPEVDLGGDSYLFGISFDY